MKLKYNDYWMRSGYIQPSGQTLLAVHWGFVPGAYQGSEVGGSWDFGQYGALSSSYLWSDKYKARGIPRCMNSAPPIIKPKSTTFRRWGEIRLQK